MGTEGEAPLSFKRTTAVFADEGILPNTLTLESYFVAIAYIFFVFVIGCKVNEKFLCKQIIVSFL